MSLNIIFKRANLQLKLLFLKMNLKVSRYINYGCTMTGGEENSCSQRFLFSFFELNNKEIINVMLVENWDKNTMTNYQLDCYNVTNSYKFGQEWGNWWKSTFDDETKSKWAKEDEDKCVKKFYKKHILNTRDIKTDILLV